MPIFFTKKSCNRGWNHPPDAIKRLVTIVYCSVDQRLRSSNLRLSLPGLTQMWGTMCAHFGWEDSKYEMSRRGQTLANRASQKRKNHELPRRFSQIIVWATQIDCKRRQQCVPPFSGPDLFSSIGRAQKFIKYLLANCGLQWNSRREFG